LTSQQTALAVSLQRALDSGLWTLDSHFMSHATSAPDPRLDTRALKIFLKFFLELAMQADDVIGIDGAIEHPFFGSAEAEKEKPIYPALCVISNEILEP